MIQADRVAGKYGVKLVIYTVPESFTGHAVDVPLTAFACGVCGYTELYVNDTATLSSAAETRRRNSQPA